MFVWGHGLGFGEAAGARARAREMPVSTDAIVSLSPGSTARTIHLRNSILTCMDTKTRTVDIQFAVNVVVDAFIYAIDIRRYICMNEQERAGVQNMCLGLMSSCAPSAKKNN